MQRQIDNIEQLYNRYAKKLYFTSLRITANQFDAEEAMQDTFIKYYSLKEKERIEKIESWLTMVCIRKSIDILRQRRKEELFMSEISAPENRNILNLSGCEKGKMEYSVEKIKEALLALPDGYRLILSLYLFEGYDYVEIAQITGLKESSVRSQYMRGKSKLAEMLKQKK